ARTRPRYRPARLKRKMVKARLKLSVPEKCTAATAMTRRIHISLRKLRASLSIKNIHLSDLKGTLELFAKEIFGSDREVRLRPSYFPFTEPSVEVDISCFKCKGAGCNVCKQTGWIEILGAGMVHPNVLEMAGFDSKEYSGFAF